MGNYFSCHFLHPKLKSPKAARVITLSGEMRLLRTATTAAELMLDHPSSFLVDSRSLHMGRRFSPLSADEDLELGHVYVMFPMRRLSSVVTAADVATFLMSLNVPAKRISGAASVKVSPDSCEAMADEKSPEKLPERFPEDVVMRYRLSVCRSKKPMLDTIIEEQPIRMR